MEEDENNHWSRCWAEHTGSRVRAAQRWCPPEELLSNRYLGVLRAASVKRDERCTKQREWKLFPSSDEKMSREPWESVAVLNPVQENGAIALNSVQYLVKCGIN